MTTTAPAASQHAHTYTHALAQAHRRIPAHTHARIHSISGRAYEQKRNNSPAASGSLLNPRLRRQTSSHCSCSLESNLCCRSVISFSTCSALSSGARSTGRLQRSAISTCWKLDISKAEWPGGREVCQGQAAHKASVDERADEAEAERGATRRTLASAKHGGEAVRFQLIRLPLVYICV